LQLLLFHVLHNRIFFCGRFVFLLCVCCCVCFRFGCVILLLAHSGHQWNDRVDELATEAMHENCVDGNQYDVTPGNSMCYAYQIPESSMHCDATAASGGVMVPGDFRKSIM
jgi:hypothetical protein